MGYAIETVGLTRTFNGIAVVDDLNLKVRRGELFGFLGPNGAGKTTTIRMLCCLLRPTNGQARINGLDVVADSLKVRSQIGLLPEFSNLYLEFSARYNVELMARLHGLSKSESRRKVNELLDLFDLRGREDDRVAVFSRGMQRRLAMAAAMAHDPEVLFLDELTSGLDVHSAKVMREIVRQLSSDGVTVFLTTHRIEDAEQLCQRIGIIDRGRLVAVNSVHELRRNAGQRDIIELKLSKSKRIRAEQVRKVEGVAESSWEEETGSLRLWVDDAEKTLPKVLETAVKNSVAILSVRIVKSSLEDVFLKLTGKPLKEEGPAVDTRLLAQKGLRVG